MAETDIVTGPVTENDTSPIRLLKLAKAAQTLAAGGGGGGVTPGQTAIVLHANGTATGYTTAADTDVARGTALLAAKEAAASGEVVEVGAGTFNVIGLGKNGVNYELPPGTLLTHSHSTNVSFFEDSGGPLVMSIRGGDFNYVPSAGTDADWGNVLNMGNAGSDIRLTAGRITSPDTNFVAFWQEAGKFNGHLQDMNVGRATYWANGDFTLKVDGTLDSAFNSCVYARVAAGATMTGKMWVSGSRAVSTGVAIASFTVDGSTGAAQVYSEWDEIQGGTSTFGSSCGYFNGNKSYIVAKKTTNTLPDVPAIQLDGGEVWWTTQKLRGMWLVSSSGSIVLQMADWLDDLGGTDQCAYLDGGTITIQAGVLKAVTANGIAISAGTLNLSGKLDFSAVANSNPITVSGGQVVLMGAVLIAASGRACIEGTGTVYCYGAKANTEPAAGITIIGDLTVNPSFV